MEKPLSQAEIDTLFRLAQGQPQGSARPGKARHFSPCNFRQAGMISPDQLRAVTVLHDTFARNLTNSLGAYLRGVFEVVLASAEQLAYTEFLQHVPELNYVIGVHLQPLDAMAAVELDLPLAFPMIDLLLGGQGRPGSSLRQITEIEEQIMESIVHVICRELQATWHSVLDIEFRFDQRQTQSQIQRLMPPNEKILALSFEIRVTEVRGFLNVIFPAVASNALLRKLAQQGSYRKHRGASGGGVHLRARLEHCLFPTELVLSGAKVSGQQLMGLRPGKVIALNKRIQDPAHFIVGGRSLFTAQPVRHDHHRAAQILERVQISTSLHKENP
ncbi:MAG TPA: FliM/FliN family flagellar motor switch protein [Terriglobia bacterium]|nr:FliM/FliN family flagellar motor switch protein [Terriglobia bacterium]